MQAVQALEGRWLVYVCAYLVLDVWRILTFFTITHCDPNRVQEIFIVKVGALYGFENIIINTKILLNT